jgi:23S rRNA (uracil1939-C5)-methyltransferase
MPIATIESLEHEGRGVTHVEGKTVFVDGALTGETVEYASYRKKPSYELAQTVRVLEPAAERVSPRCRWFGICGGCSMQHLDPMAQAAVKQRVLEDALWHIGRLRAEQLFPAIHGTPWEYRYRARLSVRLVPKKGGVLVGFHERKSSYVADMTSCEVLPLHVSKLLPQLRQLVEAMSRPNRLPQIEVAVSDAATALVLRHLEPLADSDLKLLQDFSQGHRVDFWLQPGGPDTVSPLDPAAAENLYYTLPEFDVKMRFRPTEFTQVNFGINRMLVRRAMALLEPRPGERVADMFCGLGNFTLPIARLGARVIGIEGSRALTRRAQQNADENGLGTAVEFAVANLFEATPESIAALGRMDKMLIDPPREGAIALVKALGAAAPQRIVYVSCNPATLARDAAVLVHEAGYALAGAGIANMFPQTSHVESIALFERR